MNLLQERARFLLRPLLNQCDDGQCFSPAFLPPCFFVSNNRSNCSRHQKRGGDKDSRKPSSKTRWERKKERLEADLLQSPQTTGNNNNVCQQFGRIRLYCLWIYAHVSLRRGKGKSRRRKGRGRGKRRLYYKLRSRIHTALLPLTASAFMPHCFPSED